MSVCYFQLEPDLIWLEYFQLPQTIFILCYLRHTCTNTLTLTLHTQTHTETRARTHIRTKHARTHALTHARMHAHTHAITHSHTQTHTHTHTHSVLTGQLELDTGVVSCSHRTLVDVSCSLRWLTSMWWANENPAKHRQQRLYSKKYSKTLNLYKYILLNTTKINQYNVCLEKGTILTFNSLQNAENWIFFIKTWLNKHLFLSPQEAVKKDQGLLSFPSQLGHVGPASRSVKS
jgi:hypothetical protein